MTDTSTPQDIVTVRGLRKTYGDRVVVDNLDLDIRAGEVVGLIGANGAGKTTTVECIQGLRRPDAGLLRVFGYDPAREPERLRALIGSQLQDSALPDRLRVAEAVRLFATERARDGAELLERFGLGARHRSAFASLSGGERQRLFLVLALLNRPRLVILDELTQGLDPAARRDVWTAVAQLRDEGTTVLLVTHELDEAQALCSRVIALRGRDRVLDQGTPAELIARHAGGARISFAAPGADEPAGGRRCAGCPECTASRCTNGRITVLGDRRSIAHVGAELVRRGDVPADLDVASARPRGRAAAPARLPRPDRAGHSGDRPRTGDPAMSSTAMRLIRAEFTLTLRDPLVLTFVLVFPIVTMLIIGGAFGTEPDVAFEGQNPSQWYVASYFTVVVAATGLIMLPVHLASYRERGVLRRFAAAGFPRWSFALAELALGLVTIAVAGIALLAVAAPVYGIPAVHDLGRVGAGPAVRVHRLHQPRHPARDAAAVGPGRPGRRADALLPVLPAGRRWPAATRDGFGAAPRRRRAAADLGHHRDPAALAGHRHADRDAGRGDRARGRRHRPGRAARCAVTARLGSR